MINTGRLFASFVLLFLYTQRVVASTENIISRLCPTGCRCSFDDSLLTVSCWIYSLYYPPYPHDIEPKQLDSLLSSSQTYGHLTRLHIGASQLTHVPRSVCRLTTLTQLHLDNNRLTRLPDNCLTNLTALTWFSASRNNITELQDKLFDGLGKLQTLQLSYNHITILKNGLFDRLLKLDTLSVHNNNVSSIGSRVFDGLFNLKTLDLSYNGITELENGLFDGLHKLEKLNISHNGISSLESRVFSRLSNLKTIGLCNNVITELKNGLFDGLHKLNVLYLTSNQISSIGLYAFNRLSNLEVLQLSHNNITELRDGLFDGLHQLRTLELSYNRITQLQDGLFDGLHELETLDLNHDNLPSVGSRVFNSLSNLKKLDLSYNHITELQNELFDGLRKLKILNLRFNQISSIGLHAFDRLSNLEAIALRNNNITELQDGLFDGLHMLQTLELSYNRITQLQGGVFDGLHKLEKLNLNHNNILSIGSRVFNSFSYLKTLNLSYNDIKKLENGLLDALHALETLDLSFSNISSIGSRVFHRHSSLKTLFLTSNRITQLQDRLFDGLYKLETLDLSFNNISSMGPRVFGSSAASSSLRYVDLSSNNIQTLDSWPIYVGINGMLTIDLSYNHIRHFTNMMRWKDNCGARNVRVSLSLYGNTIRNVPDLLIGWNMSLSATRCVQALKNSYWIRPTVTKLTCVYLECECADIVELNFNLRYARKSAPPWHWYYPLLSFRPLILNPYNAVPLDQFVCKLTERCPSGCRCVHRPANATLHINCSNTNHTVFPLELPTPTSYPKYILDFSNNRLLRHLEHRDYFVNTSVLDVSNSNIQQVKIEDVWKDILKIPQVNLYGNKLTSLPQSTASVNVTTVSLNIANNPWDCSCDYKWLSRWLNAISNRLARNVHCYSPQRLRGKNIIQTSEKDFCVDPAAEASKRAWIISMSSVAGVVVVLLSVIGIFYRLRVKLYTRWKFHPFDRDECPGEDMDYDVFLCCSSLDDEPVGSRILEVVEANGYRVCYHERDFMPGLITDNIEKSVTRSKRTACLLTTNFIQRSENVFFCIIESS